MRPLRLHSASEDNDDKETSDAPAMCKCSVRQYSFKVHTNSFQHGLQGCFNSSLHPKGERQHMIDTGVCLVRWCQHIRH
jgi:hypothetical protein